ncbi:MAG TPA: hypothetical protein VGB47_00010 [Thermoanaerobaculia bacterium]|jgi:hypothetical protein
MRTREGKQGQTGHAFERAVGRVANALGLAYAILFALPSVAFAGINRWRSNGSEAGVAAAQIAVPHRRGTAGRSRLADRRTFQWPGRA